MGRLMRIWNNRKCKVVTRIEQLIIRYLPKAIPLPPKDFSELLNADTNERIQIKIKVINKYFALITYGKSSPYVEPNPFEMAKQYCILQSTRANKLPLPRTGYDVYKFEDDYPDLVRWWEVLQYAPVDIIESVDFSKPYDAAIKNSFTVKKQEKIEINSDDIINAELAE